MQILAAPDNGLGQFAAAATVVTAADGSWSAPLAPGPSRLIEAVYAGDGTTEPVTSAQVKLIVPARIGMSVSPRVLPWSGTVTIHGHLMGGYVPPDGVALRLLIRYPGHRRSSSLLPLRTNARGSFKIEWSFDAGRGVASYPLWMSTNATESDYPFAAASGKHIVVTFGRPTPHHPRRRKASHHKKHRTTAQHHKHRRQR